MKEAIVATRGTSYRRATVQFLMIFTYSCWKRLVSIPGLNPHFRTEIVKEHQRVINKISLAIFHKSRSSIGFRILLVYFECVIVNGLRIKFVIIEISSRATRWTKATYLFEHNTRNIYLSDIAACNFQVLNHTKKIREEYTQIRTLFIDELYNKDFYAIRIAFRILLV